MERNPDPTVGQKLLDLPEIMPHILAINPSIHDGAILSRRLGSEYIITGWSYRLYPPPISHQSSPNKGSAYNSCADMSAVDRVEAVLLLGSGGISTFVCGQEHASEFSRQQQRAS
jgi:hypothetical protein